MARRPRELATRPLTTGAMSFSSFSNHLPPAAYSFVVVALLAVDDCSLNVSTPPMLNSWRRLIKVIRSCSSGVEVRQLGPRTNRPFLRAPSTHTRPSDLPSLRREDYERFLVDVPN